LRDDRDNLLIAERIDFAFACCPTTTFEIFGLGPTLTSTLIVDMSAIVMSGVVDNWETAYSPTE